MSQLLALSLIPALDNDGVTVPGSTISFFLSGTSTPATVFADAAMTVALGAVVTADGAGRFPDVYTDGTPLRALVVTGALTRDIDPVNTSADFLAALAGPGGAALVGVSPTGTVQDIADKVNESVGIRLEDFGGVGDLTTDDTAAWLAACAAAVAQRRPIYLTRSKRFRVTQGYAHVTASRALVIRSEPEYGAGYGRPAVAGEVVLDSTDPNSFLIRVGALGAGLFIDGMRISSAQFVVDRALILAGDSGPTQGIWYGAFRNMTFVNCDRPFVFRAPSYTQMLSFDKVEFWNSGTIYFEVGGPNEVPVQLRATLVTLHNVNAEVGVPANTAKRVISFDGARVVKCTNLLLEGVGPGTDWTVIYLRNIHDVSWARQSQAVFDNTWIEYPGATPAIAVEQIGGNTVWRGTIPNLGVGSFTTRYHLTDTASASFEGGSFASTPVNPVDLFVFGDMSSHVHLENMGTREIFAKFDQRLSYGPTSQLSSAAPAIRRAHILGSTAKRFWGWNGGIPDAPISIIAGAGVLTYENDAVYGRKISVAPAGNAASLSIKVTSPLAVQDSQTLTLMAFLKVPPFVGGSIVVRYAGDNGASGTFFVIAPDAVERTFPLSLPINNSEFGTLPWEWAIVRIAGTSIAGPIELLGLTEIVGGGVLGHLNGAGVVPVGEDRGAAPPATGSWPVGWRRWNSAPASGAPIGWLCTVAGTPGTWLPMPNL